MSSIGASDHLEFIKFHARCYLHSVAGIYTIVTVFVVAVLRVYQEMALELFVFGTSAFNETKNHLSAPAIKSGSRTRWDSQKNLSLNKHEEITRSSSRHELKSSSSSGAMPIQRISCASDFGSSNSSPLRKHVKVIAEDLPCSSFESDSHSACLAVKKLNLLESRKSYPPTTGTVLSGLAASAFPFHFESSTDTPTSSPQCQVEKNEPTAEQKESLIFSSASCEGSDVDSQVMQQMIMPGELAVLVMTQSSSVFVLDCRSFLAFNANHVVNAFNVCCFNSVTRKRLQDGKIDVIDVISGQDGKELYRNIEMDPLFEVILYDDGTTDLTTLPATHVLKVITNCLQKKGKRTRFVHGGLQAVQRTFSNICSQPDPSAVPLLFSPTSPGEISCDIDNAIASEILPYLFIGNERDASNRTRLTDLGITHIINVTAHLPLHFDSDGIEYLRLPASDSGNQNLKQFFTKAIDFIDMAYRANGRVLVHCQAGVSRSPTIVMAYLMSINHTTLTDTFALIKDRRSIVAPNLNFMGQLLEFEQQCMPRNSLCPPSQPIHTLRL